MSRQTIRVVQLDKAIDINESDHRREITELPPRNRTEQNPK